MTSRSTSDLRLWRSEADADVTQTRSPSLLIRYLSEQFPDGLLVSVNSFMTSSQHDVNFLLFVVK